VFAGGLAHERVEAESIVDDLGELVQRFSPDVLLDLTTHPASVGISMSALELGVRPVVGATGWTQDERAALETLALDRGLGAMVVPNFSIGAALMMRFSEMAARCFPTVEIIELHHDQKKDAPSGTARLTAERIVAQGRVADVPIHSVRLRGLVAHQEVLFGNTGEVLTIRHDSLARESFVAGMLAASSAVMQVRGLVVGLDALLDEME
ncbi:MAG: 4-hydroxy-tetrahydrodipicolinate reductase, partial [Vulcanimicrobiaceae bacterium]